ncbi:MAG: hypothetical protein GY811_06220 [Myxococcales bacterium]|nr:hypothetical protein [Myxococcales bacterium]
MNPLPIALLRCASATLVVLDEQEFVVGGSLSAKILIGNHLVINGAAKTEHRLQWSDVGPDQPALRKLLGSESHVVTKGRGALISAMAAGRISL